MKMSAMIKPKSDQLNGDDLIGRDLIIKITKITDNSSDQPLSIYYEGDNGKPYKAGLSMRRIMIGACGVDDPTLEQFRAVYIGTSIKLHRDPEVKWAGIEVGGLRITNLSILKEPFTMALTANSKSKKLYTVKPLVIEEVATADPELVKAGEVASSEGIEIFTKWGKGLSADDKKALKPYLADWTKTAKAVVIETEEEWEV